MNSVLQLTPAQRTELFQAAGQALGLSPVIVEKDFWVCWTLRELFSAPGIGEHLIFKGGTSLSKVWQLIERFSEDVDISLSRDWLGFGGADDPEKAPSKKQRTARIEDLATECTARVRDVLLPALRARANAVLGSAGWSIDIDATDKQTLLFRYPSAGDFGYIRGEVRIECGARSDAWPSDDRRLQPYVADAITRLDDCQVQVRVLAAERTFWEKATILHAEVHRPAEKAIPPRYSRHYADLAALARSKVVTTALADADLRNRVVQHKQVFFPSAWANYATAVPGTFRLVPDARRLEELSADYRAMREMFFREPVAWESIVAELGTLEKTINGG